MAWLERLSVIVACVLPATLVEAALEAPKQVPPPSTSLAGQLLIAAPSMGDPRFFQTVVLMARHDKNGAFGIVINRPMGERPLASLLEALGERDLGFVVHSADYHRPGTVDIDGRVAVTSNRDVLRDIAHRQGPKKSLIAFGYAGWGPGQLEGELALRAWFTAAEDARLIFDEDRDKVWDEAMKRRTQDL
jgi:putative transcriptional regulator